MPIEDRFKQPVIIALAKRAANRCSNPDCGAITSGPADDPSKAVNIGEAAHIYGAIGGFGQLVEVRRQVGLAELAEQFRQCLFIMDRCFAALSSSGLIASAENPFDDIG